MNATTIRRTLLLAAVPAVVGAAFLLFGGSGSGPAASDAAAYRDAGPGLDPAAGEPLALRAKKPRDTFERCAYFNNSTGMWEFYLSGETIQVTGSDGRTRTLMCSNGRWSIWMMETINSDSIAPEPAGVAPAAQRARKPGDTAKRCAYYNSSTGTWEFYLPGEYIVLAGADGQNHYLYCGENGRWVDSGRGAPVQDSPFVGPMLTAS
jgi:hypothetical protein